MRDRTSASLSVVVCTWNRCERLRMTLESITSTDAKSLRRCEILVVDNASTDGIAAVVSSFSEFDVRYVFEGRAGLSNARNSGARSSSFDWVLFLDDDVEVQFDFFTLYLAGIEAHSWCGYFGGPVIPKFDTPFRHWTTHVLRNHPWIYSSLDLGTPSRPFQSPMTPFGANFCVRKDLLIANPFSPEKGYRHGALVPGEETGLIAGLQAAGIEGWWLAECGVLHCLPEDRDRPKYLVRRAFGEGVSNGQAIVARGGSLRWAVPSVVLGMLRTFRTLVTSPSSVMSAVIDVAKLLGVLSTWRTRRTGDLTRRA
jgi:glucosyl-dolichyl phosphate glucuronosyltransferase